MRFPQQEVVIDYTNWRGIRSLRRIQPIRLEFKPTEWHNEPQWILEAVDVHKGELRAFAMRDIRTWIPALDEASGAMAIPNPDASEKVVCLRDVGTVDDPCWVVCAKGDPGAVSFGAIR